MRVVGANLVLETRGRSEDALNALFELAEGPLTLARNPKAAEGRAWRVKRLLEASNSAHLFPTPHPDRAFLDLGVRAVPRGSVSPGKDAMISQAGDLLDLSFGTLSMYTPIDVGYATDLYRKICAIFQASFALVDEEKAIKKPAHFDRDLRGFAWGATVYGPELVGLLGRERLLSAPAHKVEELPYGGIWVQAAENPFRAPTAAKRAIERHLELAEHFPGPGGIQMRRTALRKPEGLEHEE